VEARITEHDTRLVLVEAEKLVYLALLTDFPAAGARASNVATFYSE
jgi:hypothetical protein